MSAWLNAVDFHTPTLTSSQYAVLHAIAVHANDEGIAWPSIPLMAVRAHCSERNVKRMLLALVDAGYITKQKRFKLGGRSGNLYQIQGSILTCVENCECPTARQIRRGDISVGKHTEMSPKEINEQTNGVTRTHTRVPIKATENPGPAEAISYGAIPPGSTATIIPQSAFLPPAVVPPTDPAKDRRFSLVWQMGIAWRSAYMTEAPDGMIAKGLGGLLENTPSAEDDSLITAFRNYVNNTGARYVSIPRFAATWRTWIRGVPAKAAQENGLSSTMAAIEAVRGGE